MSEETNPQQRIQNAQQVIRNQKLQELADIHLREQFRRTESVLQFLAKELLLPDHENGLMKRFETSRDAMQTYLMGSDNYTHYIEAMSTAQDYFERAYYNTAAALTVLCKASVEYEQSRARPDANLAKVEKYLEGASKDLQEVYEAFKMLHSHPKLKGQAEFEEMAEAACKQITHSIGALYSAHSSVAGILKEVQSMRKGPDLNHPLVGG